MHIDCARLHPDRYPTDERYPFNLEVLRHPTILGLAQPVTMFVGENGSGKSTLLRALARRCGIHMWRPQVGRRSAPNPYEDLLDRFISVRWTDRRVPGSFFDGETFNHFAVVLEDWAVDDPGQLKYFGGHSLLTLSHGQSLMSFFRARYAVRGIYFLDEPETALSPSSLLELLRLLVEMARAGHAQFIIATHSPILLACPGATIYSFDSAPITPIAYEDTVHYRVYREFMADPQRWVAQL